MQECVFPLKLLSEQLNQSLEQQHLDVANEVDC